jgi:hypothetical protein
LSDTDDEVRRLPTLAVDGPWLLKKEIPGELRVWVNEFSVVRDMRHDVWIAENWVTTSYRVNGKWEDIQCQ